MILGTILASIIGYLIGNMLFGKWIVKLTTGKDITEFGSGSTGATNASRAAGKWVGLLVFFLDFAKVFLTAFIALGFASIKIKDDKYLFASTSILIPAFFTFIGHIFPVFNKFKGGKGVSSFVAVLLIYNWVLAFVFMGVWLILTFTVNKVCISSIVGIILVSILIWIPIMHNINSDIANSSLGKKFIWDWNSTPLYDAMYGLSKLGKFVPFNWMYMLKIKANVASSFKGIDSFILSNILITSAAAIVIIKHITNIGRLIKHEEPSFIDWKKIKK